MNILLFRLSIFFVFQLLYYSFSSSFASSKPLILTLDDLDDLTELLLEILFVSANIAC